MAPDRRDLSINKKQSFLPRGRAARLEDNVRLHLEKRRQLQQDLRKWDNHNN